MSFEPNRRSQTLARLDPQVRALERGQPQRERERETLEKERDSALTEQTGFHDRFRRAGHEAIEQVAAYYEKLAKGSSPDGFQVAPAIRPGEILNKIARQFGYSSVLKKHSLLLVCRAASSLLLSGLLCFPFQMNHLRPASRSSASSVILRSSSCRAQ